MAYADLNKELLHLIGLMWCLVTRQALHRAEDQEDDEKTRSYPQQDLKCIEENLASTVLSRLVLMLTALNLLC